MGSRMRFKRILAIGLAASAIAAMFEFATPIPAGATTFDYVCAGVSTDDAGGGKSSKEILEGTVSLLTGSSTLALTVDSSTDAPAKLAPGAAPFTANFDFNVSLPADLLKKGHDLLGLKTVTVKNASFAVDVSGAASGSISGTLPDTVIDLTAASLSLQQHVSGLVTPNGTGIVNYRPGLTKLTIVLGIATPKIDSLTVGCTSSKLLATTAIQVPGAPNVPSDLQVSGGPGLNGVTILDKVTPDNGRPVINGSLAVTDQPTAGNAVAANGALFFAAPSKGTNADYTVGMQVCSDGGFTDAIVGTAETEQMSWGQASYANQSLNAHPLGFKLSFKGQTTGTIVTGFNKVTNAPTDPNNTLEILAFSEFRAPSAATVQAALEKLSTIGAGNISVTGGVNGAPYTFKFAGALGADEQPHITIDAGNWISWLPADTVTKLADLIPKPEPVDPNAPPTTAPLTVAQIDALLPTIGFDAWLAKRAALLTDGLLAGASGAIGEIGKLIPKQPVWDYEIHHGNKAVPSAPRGPLCSPFTVTFHIAGAAVAGKVVYRAKNVCKTVRVRVKGHRHTVKKKVCTVYVFKPVPTRVRVTTTKVVTVHGKHHTIKLRVWVTKPVGKWVKAGPGDTYKL